jgi:hypothetical protein
MASLRASRCRVLVGSLSLVFGIALGGMAHAACLDPGQQLPADAVNAFNNNPTSLLQQFPDGGNAMASRIRDLAASDTGTLLFISQLAGSANAAQKAAIGAGLGQAATMCGGIDRSHGNLIQQAVVQTGDRAVVTAYAGVTGQQPLGGLGSNLGGLGGSIGGQTNPFGTGPSSTGGPLPIGIPGVPTPLFTYTSSVGSASTSSGDNGDTPPNTNVSP